MVFTDAQLTQFARYVKVQKSSKYNMLTPDAARAASLSTEQMMFIMENYDQLAQAAEAQVKTK